MALAKGEPDGDHVAMEEILFQYQFSPTTWAYVSSIALIAFFFKFSRLLSVRNLDLIALIALAPGLLLVSYGQDPSHRSLAIEASGYFTLLGVSLFFFGRLVSDLFLTRRPLLEPNLSLGGLACMIVALSVFLIGGIMYAPLDPASSSEAAVGPVDPLPQESTGEPNLVFVFFDLLRTIPSKTVQSVSASDDAAVDDLTSRILCILAHFAVVAGLIFAGYRHFDNLWTGVAMATIYLMLPYTAQMAGRVHHVAPAALLVWSLVMYRHPLAAGTLLGLSIGLIYYPVFLLPLWLSFYLRRGVVRFLSGLGATLLAMALFLWVLSKPGEFPSHVGMFVGHFGDMFRLSEGHAEGIWVHWHLYSRLPVTVLFCCFAVGMALWPARKNLGTLMSCSAAVMLGTQFWYPEGGLLFMNWYLPMLLLTIFRPNLEHRVATTSVATRAAQRRARVRAVKELQA